jgi:predicted histidine transporter YuiF (NhaC family)
MNAVVISVGAMLLLSLFRMNVVISLILGALIAGLTSEIGIAGALTAFNIGLGGGASIALSYGLLGAFALALAESGMPHALTDWLQKKLKVEQGSKVRWALITGVGLLSMASQNILPIHIAFIPLVIPPLLLLMIQIKLDRRLMACVITFGLITPYILFPTGFGEIFLKQILLGNLSRSGLEVTGINIMQAMWLPALGMLGGLLIAIFISYRKPRCYTSAQIEQIERESKEYTPRSLSVAVLAIVIMLSIQIVVGSMMFGALAGFLTMLFGGVLRWKTADTVFGMGIRVMAGVGLIMIAASGFAEVLKQTGHIQLLVVHSVSWMGGSKGVAAFMMLFVGLLITLGIGSSFSTIPIIAALYVPLAMQMGFSALAIVSLVGTAGALGDAGSPASDSTLGPTAGLNIDGQHNHIWDSVVPTFIHYNIPLLIMGWVAAMTL